MKKTFLYAVAIASIIALPQIAYGKITDEQIERELETIKYNRAYTKCAHLFGRSGAGDWKRCIDKSVKDDERRFDFFRKR